MQESSWRSERVPGEVELAIWRAGEGPDPVICLHGITAQHRAFNAAARYLGPSRGLVALKTALAFPERVRSLVLLDGGWPRVETSPEEMTEEEKQEAAALEEGLARAFRRLDMVFESPEAYLDFWFPDRGLTMEDLPPDLADYYLYDLEEVEGGYRPKASRAAAEEDSASVSSTSPTS